MIAIAAALALWLCAVAPASAQEAGRLPLVGVLRIQTGATSEPFAGLLSDALAALGDVDDKTIHLEFPFGRGRCRTLSGDGR